jgi:chemotaxis protein histidine kinase CheA
MKQKFFNDTIAQLNILLNSILIFEEEPDNLFLVDDLMRIAHSLKGSSRVMEFRLLESLFHDLEDKFSRYKKEKPPSISSFIDEVLTLGNKIQFCLDMLFQGFPEAEIVEKLEGSLREDTFCATETIELQLHESSSVQVGINRLDSLSKLISELLVKEVSAEHYLTELESLESDARHAEEEISLMLGDWMRSESLAVAQGFSDSRDLLSRMADRENSLRTIDENRKKLWRNLKMILPQQRCLLELVQRRILQARLTPISQAFEMIPRHVRDLCKSQGKKVKLTIDGEDTLLDKYVLDGISTCLLHLIRNAIDHGIESPEHRVREGKSESGRLYIGAVSQGNRVTIKVEDDGQGIDEEKLRKRLTERGLLTTAELQAISPRDLYQYLLRQGVSTKDEVDLLSGRGVGMDVVRENLERLKGSITIQSEKGIGTLIEIEVPLTLSIMQAIPVGLNDEMFCIPYFNIEKVLALSPDELVKKGRFYFNPKTGDTPLIPLSDILHGENQKVSEEKEVEDRVVILRSVEKRWGIIVNEVHQRREIVVKDLGSFIKRIRHILGATVTGDGTIILVLDVPSLFKTMEKWKKAL